MRATPLRLYELSGGLTEEAIAVRLVAHLDAIIVKTNARLKTKASLLAVALMLTIVALSLALATM
jgi:hypothetical protein